MPQRTNFVRTWVTGLALGPALLLLAAGAATLREPLSETPCWILPNARVLKSLAPCSVQ